MQLSFYNKLKTNIIIFYLRKTTWSGNAPYIMYWGKVCRVHDRRSLFEFDVHKVRCN